MPKTGYSFKNIESVATRIVASDPYPTSLMMNDLKKELNKFFTEAECLEVIFTKNTDKVFFGMCVMPLITKEETVNIVLSDEKMTIKKYYLEIDSKILQLGLTADEFIAVLLHEIGHIVIDDKPIKIVRANIDKYFADNDEIIKYQDSLNYVQLLQFAVTDTIQKMTSLIFKDEDELVADVFCTACGYGDSLVSAQQKILNNIWGLSKDTKGPKLLILDWCFRLYTNVKYNRIPAIRTLQKAKNFTASQLTQKQVQKTIDALNRIDTDVQHEFAYLEESSKKNSFFGKLKSNGLKSLEDDYYEFKVRVKNANTEEDALYTLRQINSRLSILEDYLSSDDIDEKEHERWYQVLEKYRELRADLASKKVYNRKNYGIWYSYNDLDTDEGKMY